MRSLAKRFEVRLIAGVFEAQQEGIVDLEQAGVSVRPVCVGPRRSWCEGARAIAAALCRKPYVLFQRHNRSSIRAAILAEKRREPPDLFYLDHLDSSVFFRHYPGAPVAIDLHNVYSLLVGREAEEQHGPTRLYLQREAKLLGRAEERAVRLADVVFSVSEPEAVHFRALGGRTVHVVPNGVDCTAYASLPTGRRGGPPVILYVGTMSWAPNASAARFLVNDVLPRVHERLPATELWIVGKDPPPDLLRMGNRQGVRVTGGVPSMIPFLRDAHVLAVPLEAGGGTRLKILEAFAAGLPVLSTAVGCEGLKVVAGEHLLVRERVDFADGLAEALTAPTTGEALAERARELVRRLYDWDAVGKLACDAIEAAICYPRG